VFLFIIKPIENHHPEKALVERNLFNPFRIHLHKNAFISIDSRGVEEYLPGRSPGYKLPKHINHGVVEE
jgi:hypothetical protein